MKKKNQKSQWGIITFLIALCMSLSFMTACKSEDSGEDAGNTDITGSDITCTFKVSQADNEDSVATRSVMAPQTVTRDLGNGMMLVGTLTDEAGGAATRVTTTAPIADGTNTTAYVCESGGTITNVQTATVSGSSLTVRCPNGSSAIHFLIGTAPSATAGSNINGVTTAVSSANWDYQHASAAVPTNSDNIGTIIFHHVFTEAKVTMTSSNGSTVVGGFTGTISGIARSSATLYTTNTYTATGSPAAISCAGSGGTEASLSSSYTPFISTATGSSAPATLTITQITYGGKTYNYSSNNTLTFNGTFAQGHKYNFKVVLQTRDYYTWDAYASYHTGSNTFSTGNYGFNHATSGAASHSCANCPTKQQAMNYLAAGVYWDDGITLAGSTTPSYTLSDGNTYHAGLWLKKGASTGSYTTDTATPLPVTAAIRNSGRYFFLPAAGNYFSYSPSTLSNPGTYGYYWLSTLDCGENAWSFRFCKYYTGVMSDYRQDGFCTWKAQ